MSNVHKQVQPRHGRWHWTLTILVYLTLPGVTHTCPAPPPGQPLIEVRTSLGTMIIALYDQTPLHRDNFLRRVRSGACDSLLFHRVVPGFTIEGGLSTSFTTPHGQAVPTPEDSIGIDPEFRPGLIHKHGAIGALPATVPGRSHTEGFYIVLGTRYGPHELARFLERRAEHDPAAGYTKAEEEAYATVGGLPHLDGAYTVFGEVVSGTEVLDALAAVACNEWDRPLSDVRMFMRELK